MRNLQHMFETEIEDKLNEKREQLQLEVEMQKRQLDFD